ncbi:MAG: Fic family protein [Pseudobdellovibrio sp.]
MKRIFKNKAIVAGCVGLVLSAQANACDSYLLEQASGQPESVKFARDCKIQDQYEKLKNIFSKHGRNIVNVNEYKSLRFIDRNSWEKNKNNRQLSPLYIYEPAPDTWNVWSKGIALTVEKDLQKGRLEREDLFNKDYFSYMNKVLLTDGDVSVKDPNINKEKLPGTFRDYMDYSSGFCDQSNSQYDVKAKSSQKSLQLMQKRWESAYGSTFINLVKKHDLEGFITPSLVANMNVAPYSCGANLSGTFVKYTPGEQVEQNMNWLILFTKENMRLYKNKKAIMPPIELAALVQKWFVTVHPFADGNGRTSRAVQDVLLAHFGMPFAPGGDLQNDIFSDYDQYIEDTYTATQNMLNKLERCAQILEDNSALPFECKDVNNL